MQLTVRLFAGLRERAGSDRVQVELPDGARVSDLLVAMDVAPRSCVVAGDLPKGDVVAVARIAAIQAAKRTAELIPLCHQLPLSHADCDLEVDAAAGTVTLIAQARTVHGTGVEMEALTAASVGALTVYDMVKGVEKGVTVEEVALLDKTGGKSGDWHR